MAICDAAVPFELPHARDALDEDVDLINFFDARCSACVSLVAGGEMDKIAAVDGLNLRRWQKGSYIKLDRTLCRRS